MTRLAPWGKAPTPLLPGCVRDAIGDQRAPAALHTANGEDLRLADLGPQYWDGQRDVSTATLNSLASLVHRHFGEIAYVTAVSEPPPIDSLERLPLRVRTINCVSAAGYAANPSKLVGLTVSELLEMRNFGAVSLLDLLCVLEALSSRRDAHASSPPDKLLVAVPSETRPNDGGWATPTTAIQAGEDASGEVEASQQVDVVSLLREIAAWGAGEHRHERFDDLFKISIEPPAGTVDDAWSILRGLPLAEMAGEGWREYSPYYAVSQFLEDLEERQLLILDERLLPASAHKTLDELAQGLGVTRERVRQLESRLKTDLETSEALAPVRRRADEVAETLGAAVPADAAELAEALANGLRDIRRPTPATPESREASLLLYLAGPYKEQDGWLIDRARRDQVSSIEARLIAVANEIGVIDPEEQCAVLNEAGIDPRWRDMWVSSLERVRQTSHGLIRWDGPTLDKLHLLLRLRGQPATVEELLLDLGRDMSIVSIRGRMTEDDRFVRIDKTGRFALPEWDLDEYTSVADEIAQEIERCGGTATLDHLMRTISETYAVRPSSVKAYAKSPRFMMNQHGDVRLRESDDEPFRSDASLHLTRGCYLVDDAWTYRILVDADLLRGSGRGCPPAFAEALGVYAGDRTTLSYGAVDVYLGWPETSFTGPAFGSLREVAVDLGAEEDDWLFLSAESGRLYARLCRRRNVDSAAGLDRTLVLMGVDSGVENPYAAIAVAVGLEPDASADDIRDRLRRRGENDLAAKIDVQQPDKASVREALSGLRELFS